MIITILIFILILGVLIFVHELGHFMTARRNGITSHEFGFGFPPRVVGVVKQPETGKWKVIFGNREYFGNNTLYSLNMIPLGGFVRIKGENPVDESSIEDMDSLSEADKEYVKMSSDPDSFAVQPKWTRFKVLVAGVVMNFILGWILISVVLMVGAPEPLSDKIDPTRIVDHIGVQIVEVESGSPADEIGLRIGDTVNAVCADGTCVDIENSDHLRASILAQQGREIDVLVERGDASLTLTGVPRTNVGEDQGALGIKMMDTVLVRYPFFSALWEGVMRVIGLIVLILQAFGMLLWSLFGGQGISAEIAGPVGIAMMTQQMRDLGIIYLLQFTAILSINLGIINILPIPALDGGRIIFLIIEAIKGRPVNQRIEGVIHTTFFMLLIGLMIVITVRDVWRIF